MSNTISDIIAKYGIDSTKGDILQDIKDLTLEHLFECDKEFGLRASKGSEPIFTFTAHVQARCTVWDLFQRAMQPMVINWQNSHRQTKKETLEAANTRLSQLPKEFTLTVTPLNERERGEMDQDKLISKLNVGAMTDAQAAELLRKLRERGIDLSA